MLLAPFLWIFCEFDEKVLDNLSLEWTSSAEGYFSIDKNGDVQILHMMEWKDYNESKKR